LAERGGLKYTTVSADWWQRGAFQRTGEGVARALMEFLGDADVWLQIARELSFRDVGRLCCVCRWFAGLLKDNVLWRYMLERYTQLEDQAQHKYHATAQHGLQNDTPSCRDWMDAYHRWREMFSLDMSRVQCWRVYKCLFKRVYTSAMGLNVGPDDWGVPTQPMGEAGR
jgi:hypothetical protein